MIENEMLAVANKSNNGPVLDNQRLNPEIEESLRLIEEGSITDKSYTGPEFLQYVDKVLKEEED